MDLGVPPDRGTLQRPPMDSAARFARDLARRCAPDSLRSPLAPLQRSAAAGAAVAACRLGPLTGRWRSRLAPVLQATRCRCRFRLGSWWAGSLGAALSPPRKNQTADESSFRARLFNLRDVSFVLFWSKKNPGTALHGPGFFPALLLRHRQAGQQPGGSARHLRRRAPSRSGRKLRRLSCWRPARCPR